MVQYSHYCGPVVHACYADAEPLCGGVWPYQYTILADTDAAKIRRLLHLKDLRFCRRCAKLTDERPAWLARFVRPATAGR